MGRVFPRHNHRGRPLNRYVRRHVKRIVVAFLIVPLVPPILFGITMTVWGLTSSFGIDSPKDYAIAMPIWAMFAVPVSYAAAVGVGLPAFLLFRRMGWLSLERVTGATSVVGLAIGICVAMLFDFKLENGGVAAVVAIFLAFGAITGISFWWLIKERGKRDA